MRIEKITFQNLNSLVGRFEIDLTDPAYRDSGLFVIAGPTGAGKSTILDAISLALFSQTPRLGAINISRDGVNELMSRLCWRCQAEVVFSIGNRRWRAEWSQHRAGKRPDGVVQKAQHTLTLLDGEWPEHLDRSLPTRDLVAAVTRLNFERFTRTMLLAQGQFSTFLFAAESERANLLEEITGTGFFGSLSGHVYAQTELRRKRCAELSAPLDLLAGQLLAAEIRDAVQTELMQSRAEAADIGARLQQMREFLQWRREGQRLAAAMEQAQAHQQAWRLREKNFAAEAARLAAHRLTLHLQEAFLQLSESRKRAARLHSEVANAERRAAELQSASASAERHLEACRQTHQTAVEAWDQAYQEAETARSYDALIRDLELRLREREALGADLERFQQLRRQQRQTQTEAAQVAETLRALEQQSAQAAQTCRQWEAKLAQAREAELLSNQIRSLDARRRELVADMPCPLCGALHHPYAEGVPEIPPEAGRVRDFEQELQTAQAAAHQNSELYHAALRQAEVGKTRATELARQLTEGDEKLQSAFPAVADAERQNVQQEAFQRLQQELQRLRTARGALLGGQKVDACLNELQLARQSSQTVLTEAQKQLAADEATLNELKMQIARLRRDSAEAAAESQAQTQSFQAKLQTNGWADEAAYQTARLAPAVARDLEQHQEQLQQELHAAATQIAQLQEQAAAESAKALTPLPLEELATQTGVLETARQELLTRIGRLEAQLAADRKLQSDLAERRRQLEAYRPELERWERLCRLIGSARGDSYRRYAQGITLELLLAEANLQLQALKSRYSLVRTGQLELAVLDHEQGALQRPVRTLSGGESFVVSLALALGLSQMTGGSLAIDTLFLDEGFGTLDAKSLEIALQALNRLRDRGKLIGVISHVELLQQRINVRIEVKKIGGGRSEITGPGCRTTQGE